MVKTLSVVFCMTVFGESGCLIYTWAIPKSTTDWLVKKRFDIVPKHRLSSNKWCLLSLNTYPHAFSLRSVGVIADETWTLSSPLPPGVKYVLWSVFFMQKDKARPRFIVDCVVYTVIMLWVTVVWENGAENSGMGALMCITKVVKDDTIVTDKLVWKVVREFCWQHSWYQGPQ
jgi:hypothetical protein